MLGWLVALVALIRVVPSPYVAGVLDLQRLTPEGWVTYNNISVLADVGGWNSSELNGGTITQDGATFRYARFDNGAEVTVTISTTGLREICATAQASPNVTRLSLTNDYGLATRAHTLLTETGAVQAASFAPHDGHLVPGAFVPVSPGRMVLFGDGITQYQHAAGATEAWVEIRRTPWLATHPDPGRNWIERVHLTRQSNTGTWCFGYSPNVTLPMLAN